MWYVVCVCVHSTHRCAYLILDTRLLDILHSWTSRYILKKIINQFFFSRMNWRWRRCQACFSQGYFPEELKLFLDPRYFGLIESVMKIAEDSIVFIADAMNNKDQLRWGVKKLCGIWHSSSGREVHSTAAD